MTILLDENDIDIPFKLLSPYSVHEVYTIRDMKWNCIKKGTSLIE